MVEDCCGRIDVQHCTAQNASGVECCLEVLNSTVSENDQRERCCRDGSEVALQLSISRCMQVPAGM